MSIGEGQIEKRFAEWLTNQKELPKPEAGPSYELLTKLDNIIHTSNSSLQVEATIGNHDTNKSVEEMNRQRRIIFDAVSDLVSRNQIAQARSTHFDEKDSSLSVALITTFGASLRLNFLTYAGPLMQTPIAPLLEIHAHGAQSDYSLAKTSKDDLEAEFPLMLDPQALLKSRS